MLLFVAVLALVLTLLAVVHWYVWRRLVRDVTRPGSALRRAGTVAAVALPLLSLGALTSARAGAPFWLQQVVAWPGQMWLALLLYLVLALLVTEALRPVLMRWPRSRAAADHPAPASVPGADAPAAAPDGAPPPPHPARPAPPPRRPTRVPLPRRTRSRPPTARGGPPRHRPPRRWPRRRSRRAWRPPDG